MLPLSNRSVLVIPSEDELKMVFVKVNSVWKSFTVGIFASIVSCGAVFLCGRACSAIRQVESTEDSFLRNKEGMLHITPPACTFVCRFLCFFFCFCVFFFVFVFVCKQTGLFKIGLLLLFAPLVMFWNCL